jgi:hypothetical protein
LVDVKFNTCVNCRFFVLKYHFDTRAKEMK